MQYKGTELWWLSWWLIYTKRLQNVSKLYKTQFWENYLLWKPISRTITNGLEFLNSTTILRWLKCMKIKLVTVLSHRLRSFNELKKKKKRNRLKAIIKSWRITCKWVPSHRFIISALSHGECRCVQNHLEKESPLQYLNVIFLAKALLHCSYYYFSSLNFSLIYFTCRIDNLNNNKIDSFSRDNRFLNNSFGFSALKNHQANKCCRRQQEPIKSNSN